MRKELLRRFIPLLSLVLFILAILVLHNELRAYHFSGIMQDLKELPAGSIALALALTVLSYLVLTGYDALALRYIRHPLSYAKIAFTSFIGYAFSNSMGLSFLTSGSIRYRLYTAWGFTGLEVTKIVAFCGMTLWFGFLTLAGVVFLVEPLAIPLSLHLPFASARPVGAALVGLVVLFFLFTRLRKRPFSIRGVELTLPEPRLFLTQISIGSIDWMAAGTVLYVLFPGLSNLSYPMFISIYLLAQFAGLLSHVPGGLGVFETVIILLLPPSLKPAEILAALVAYRVIYYLLPLLAAAVLLGAREVLEKKENFKRAAEIYSRWASSIVPTVLAFTIFVGGAILLFSGATPSFRGRLDWLGDFLPLPVLEASHFLGSLTGVGLMILARGLQRRFDTAYVMTAALLGAGVAFSLLKGLDYEEAITLSVMLGALLPCHKYFYRKTSLMNEQFTPGWVAAVAIVILGSIWLGLFSYKHVEYSSDLWWRFSLTGHAPRFLRAAVGTVVLALMFAMIKLLHPAQPKPHLPDSKDIERAYDIVRGFKKTYACFALLGDKAFLFNRKGNAFIMYGVAGRSWVALGDPVGPQEEWPELVWQFREMCDRYDGWTVFYKVEPENLPLYIDLGLTLLKFGEEAMVPLENFSLEGGARKGLRYTNRKLLKEGCSFEVVPAGNVSPLLPELKTISDTWLREKNTREKGFSLGFFKEDYLKCFPIALVRKEGKIVGFANVLPGADKEELSIDLMRYLPGAAPGVMEYLFIQLMLWGNRQGYRWFNLGMAPLSGLEARSLAPMWNRIAALIFRYGEHFYNFQGLRLYKQKFDPIWEPRYLASPGGMALPRIFTNLASLTSSGFKGILVK